MAAELRNSNGDRPVWGVVYFHNKRNNSQRFTSSRPGLGAEGLISVPRAGLATGPLTVESCSHPSWQHTEKESYDCFSLAKLHLE
jgi:hypothetical protein